MENVLLGIPIGTIVFLIPLLPLIGALLNGFIAILCRNGRHQVPKPLVGVIGFGLPLLSFVITLWMFSYAAYPATGFTTSPLWRWISAGNFLVDFSFKIDRLSLLMSLIVTGVGSLIHLYSIGYMAHDKGFARYFCYLNLFLFSMLILILAGSLPLLFVGWEGVGVCSYFLIGFWFTDPAKAAAGMKAFVVNRIGDFGFLLGMFLLYQHLSQAPGDPQAFLSFDFLEQHRTDLITIATPVALLLFLGACGKSAQIPLYVWLPDAMAGPTPVSALIHAATMVTAGVYMICRLHFLYTLTPFVMEVVAMVGVATALFAALMAITQSDIKKVLAYSTVSQLGYLFFAVGSGAFAAALFHLMTHAFFKACLFLGSGSVIHAMNGEQNIWKMGGLKSKMPITFYTFLASVLAISGIFPFSGFFSKDAILWQGFATGHTALWVLAFITSGLTAFYMWRLVAAVFLGKPRDHHLHDHAHESPITMTIPLILLGILAVVSGWIGIPEVLKGHDRFFHWFAPLFAYEDFFHQLEAKGHGVELLLMIVTSLWVVHLAVFAMVLYSQKLSVAERWSKKMKALHTLTFNKFYVDEIYQLIIIRPIVWISDKILWKFNDQKVVDSLMVEGTAETVGLLGRTVGLLQNGIVQTYAFFLGLGAILLVAYLSLWA